MSHPRPVITSCPGPKDLRHIGDSWALCTLVSVLPQRLISHAYKRIPLYHIWVTPDSVAIGLLWFRPWYFFCLDLLLSLLSDWWTLFIFHDPAQMLVQPLLTVLDHLTYFVLRSPHLTSPWHCNCSDMPINDSNGLAPSIPNQHGSRGGLMKKDLNKN